MGALRELRIKNRLGMSGCAQIFLAHDPVLDRQVMIQVIRSPWGGSRLRDLARLRHPALVPIYSVEEDPEESSLVVVMEYVAGQTLSSLIAAGSLGLPAALRIGREIAGALAEIHAHDLFHGDLRTDNVLITSSGEVKVLLGTSPALVPRIFAWRRFDFLDLAHPLYPEPFQGAEADFRSDLFALGTLLYEMVTGVSPFEDLSSRRFVENVSSYQQVPAAQIATGVPEDLSDLIQTLLAKLPEDRGPRMSEVEEYLASIEERVIHAAEPEIDQLYRELRQLRDRSSGDPHSEAIQLQMERLRDLQQREALELRQRLEASLSLKSGAGYKALQEAQRLLTRDEDPALPNGSPVQKD